MEKIEPGKYIEFIYDLYQVNPDGSEQLRHQSDREDPDRLIFGVTPGLVPILEKTLAGLKPGDKFDVTAKPEEGFGRHNPDEVLELDRAIFEVEGKFPDDIISVGSIVPMRTADGYHINGLVLDVTDSKVKMDFNHPLADKPVRFVGEVLAVRPATPEELSPSCGCGCGHGSCGDNCGDGCGCDSKADGGCGCAN